MSLRGRLLLVSMLTLASGLGGLLVAANLLLGRTVTGLTASLIRARMEAELAALDVGPSGILIRRVVNDQALDSYAWVFSQGRVLERPEGVPRHLDDLAVRLGRSLRRRQVDAGGDTVLRSQPVRLPHTGRLVGAAVVGISTEPLAKLRRNVLFGSLAVAGLILLVGAAAIWVALRSALDPVRRMTADAEDWGAHDLDRRFDLGPPRDEISGLAATLDHLLERIAASRRHEQRFAADVAHELRTPLAAIRGHAEFALSGGKSTQQADRLHALQAIRSQTEQMTATIDTLIAVARREFEPDPGRVDLLAVAREFTGIEVRADGPVPPAEGDPAVIRQALAPLIDNARRHAASTVRMEVRRVGDRVQVVVRDDGPGVRPEERELVFKPGARASTEGSGAGLGLPLARRLVRSCGGEVRVGDGPGGCFVLELSALE